MLRYVNEALKRPLAALKVNPGDIDAAKEASRLLRLINDGERDEALWRNVADAGHKAEAIAELGRTLANEQKFSEAVSVLEDAAQRGVDTSAVLSQAKLNAGLKSDLPSLEMKDLTTNRLDISGADLRERNLSGLKANELAAHGANLTNADMSGVAMTVAQLTQAVLDGANLDRARIHQVDLSGARLRRASLKSADFAIVAATDADFREIAAEGLRAGGIRMAGAKFDGAHLAGANFDYARGAGSFINADLTGATFRRAKLGGVNFDGAKFDKVDFSDAIYDCETRFPSGFSPEAHPEMTRWVGPCKWEKQDRSGPVDHVILKGCGDECHAWLIADPRRFVLVSTREAKIFYAAAFSHDKNCPWLRSDLFTQVIQNGSVGFDFDYVDRLKQAGFCPHIRPESSPDETAPLFSPTVNMDVWKGDVLRSILMSRAEFQSKAAPAIGRISPADRRAQILNLYLSFNAVDFVDLLADEFVAVLESDSQSQIDVEHIAFSPKLVSKLIVAMEGDRRRLALPGFSRLLGSFAGQNVAQVSWGSDAICTSAERIGALLPHWGDDVRVDAAWARTTALCKRNYAGPLKKALLGHRPDVVASAIESWRAAARFGLPSATAALPEVLDVLSSDRLPENYYDPDWPGSRGPKPIVAIAHGLDIMEKGSVAIAQLKAAGRGARADELARMLVNANWQ